LLQTFRSGLCMPERWHADNGGEFKNFHMDAVRALLAINCDVTEGMLLPYSHSMPRNPQCQGLVERMNRTIKHSLQKMLEADGYVSNVDKQWEWRPYLNTKVYRLNRRAVKIYRVSPIIMLTGQPSEAPDHMALTPEELRRLHIFAADQMKRQAQSTLSRAIPPFHARAPYTCVAQPSLAC
jgi:transposase InsO family protein